MRDATPKSRRDRPSKPPLSREWIVQAAAQILKNEGLTQVTMRRVAQELDTGAASLYVYIANTAALHAELLEHLLSELSVPVLDGDDWQERLLTYLEHFSAVLMTYPGLARSALITRPSGPHYLQVHETVAELLVAGGISVASALWGADLLILMVTASAAEHTTPAEEPTPSTSPTFTSAHPLLSAHTDILFGGSPSGRQRWQLQTVITGLRNGPVPTYQEEQP